MRIPRSILFLAILISCFASCSRCYKCSSSFSCTNGGVTYNEEHCLKWGEKDIYSTNPCCIPQ
ncbi:MAG: hypothetical protein U0V74_02775 [Chitinophagales bacterium]